MLSYDLTSVGIFAPLQRFRWLGEAVPSADPPRRRYYFSPQSDSYSIDADRLWFESCARRWRRETLHLSSLQRIQKHPAFFEMLAIGKAIIPWALGRIKDDLMFFLLLDAMVIDPPRIKSEGDLEAVQAAWLEWGTARGYLP